MVYEGSVTFCQVHIRLVLIRLALIRLALIRLALIRLALIRLALIRLVIIRLVFICLVHFSLVYILELCFGLKAYLQKLSALSIISSIIFQLQSSWGDVITNCST